MGMPGRDKEPFKVALKGYGHAVVMGDANEDRCRHIWERLIAGSGAWRADYIEAAHATVPGRRCDESRLMKPAPGEAIAMSPVCLLFHDGQGG